jgi:hypothetical protein
MIEDRAELAPPEMSPIYINCHTAEHISNVRVLLHLPSCEHTNSPTQHCHVTPLCIILRMFLILRVFTHGYRSNCARLAGTHGGMSCSSSRAPHSIQHTKITSVQHTGTCTPAQMTLAHTRWPGAVNVMVPKHALLAGTHGGMSSSSSRAPHNIQHTKTSSMQHTGTTYTLCTCGLSLRVHVPHSRPTHSTQALGGPAMNTPSTIPGHVVFVRTPFGV